MYFLISALGSAGDVHPFIAISQALLERGHEVRMIAAPPFEERVRRAGIDFAALGAQGDYERMVRRPELWHPRLGPRLLLDELLRSLPEAYALTLQSIRPGNTVLVGSTLSWGMRLVQETTGLPAATVHLSPVCLPSATQPPVLPGLGDVSWLPAWSVRLMQTLVERLVLDRVINARLTSVRAELGLAPVQRILSQWINSPDLVIGAWPEWFAPAQPDWPRQAVTSGFPIFDEARIETDASLEGFLDAGTRPVGITPGSAMAHGQRFFARALDACKAAGRRALLVTPYRDQLPAELPPWAHHVAYAPFSALLPRLSALVHHGGIGTSAQALAAGLPQLVIPFAHDQFDNAARLQRIGVGRTLADDAAPGRWREALRELLESDDVARSVRDHAARMSAGDLAGKSTTDQSGRSSNAIRDEPISGPASASPSHLIASLLEPLAGQLPATSSPRRA